MHYVINFIFYKRSGQLEIVQHREQTSSKKRTNNSRSN